MKKAKITEVPPEAWEKVDQIRQEWIDRQIVQSSEEDIRKAVTDVYALMDLPAPEIHCVESPYAAFKYVKGLGEEKDNINPYWSIWWQSWAGWYEGAKILGVEFDEEKFNIFINWAKHCTFTIPYDKLCVVSHRPVEVHWQDNLLHNEKGPSVKYADGWAIWSIEGNQVDEQIVMRPETQTIEQIAKEENEEIRRIRIDRFGWSRYLDETSSEVLDQRRNDIEATYEILAETPIGQRLITFCPSTGRRYSLGIPGNRVKTCEEAQQRLWGDRNVYFIGRT